MGVPEVFKGPHDLPVIAQIVDIRIKSELPIVDHSQQFLIGPRSRGLWWRTRSSDSGFQIIPLRAQPLVQFVSELRLTDFAVLQRIPRHLEFRRQGIDAFAEQPQILIREQYVLG